MSLVGWCTTPARRRSVVSALGCAVLALSTPLSARADPLKCRAAIVKEAGKLARAKFKALQKCEERVVKDKLPLGTDCRADAKTAAAIAKAETKLRTALPKKCGGGNKICNAADAGDDADDPLATIGWDIGACRDIEHAGCTNAIVDCGDIADCLVCANRAPVERAIALYYDALMLPSAASNTLNKCQRAIGKETARFFAAKSTTLGKCWAAVSKGKAGFSAPCPAGDASGKTAAVIAKAESQTVAKICKACGGEDKACGAGDDLAPDVIGFPQACPLVTVPDGSSCGGAVTTLEGLIGCVACVTEFKADCLDALTVPWGTVYPDECNPDCGNAVRDGSEECDGTDDAACPGGCQLDCTCAHATPTPGETVTPTPTGVVTPPPTATLTFGPTPTPSETPLSTGVPHTSTPTPTVTSTPSRTATATPSPSGVIPTKTPTPSPVPTNTPTCGDGLLNQPSEECDPPADSACPDECQVDCTCPVVTLCGNGILDPGEECDSTPCPPGEQCREADCTCVVLPICGNGIIDPGEHCDGMGCAPGEECLADCTCSVTPLCGNGIKDPGEECDNTSCPGGLECLEDCTCG